MYRSRQLLARTALHPCPPPSFLLPPFAAAPPSVFLRIYGRSRGEIDMDGNGTRRTKLLVRSPKRTQRGREGGRDRQTRRLADPETSTSRINGATFVWAAAVDERCPRTGGWTDGRTDTVGNCDSRLKSRANSSRAEGQTEGKTLSNHAKGLGGRTTEQRSPRRSARPVKTSSFAATTAATARASLLGHPLFFPSLNHPALARSGALCHGSLVEDREGFQIGLGSGDRGGAEDGGGDDDKDDERIGHGQ